MPDPPTPDADARGMEMALAEARRAAEAGEVPVGAVLLAASGEILAAAHNQVVARSDPTAHAEMQVLRAAAARTGNYRLLSTTLYVTVEPCVMCMGAIIHARVARVVFGAPDPRWGGAGSLYHLAEDRRFNHHPQVEAGVLAEPCRELIRSFFQTRRRSVKPPVG